MSSKTLAKLIVWAIFAFGALPIAWVQDDRNHQKIYEQGWQDGHRHPKVHTTNVYHWTITKASSVATWTNVVGTPTITTNIVFITKTL